MKTLANSMGIALCLGIMTDLQTFPRHLQAYRREYESPVSLREHTLSAERLAGSSYFLANALLFPLHLPAHKKTNELTLLLPRAYRTSPQTLPFYTHRLPRKLRDPIG